MESEDENVYMNGIYAMLSDKRGKLDGLTFVEPQYKKPKVEHINYSDEYIVRYFVKKSNSENSTIYEVDSIQFNTLQKNSFYTCIPVLWKITGNIDTIESDETEIVGVRDFNLKSVQKAKVKIKNIEKVLNNPLEFYKNI